MINKIKTECYILLQQSTFLICNSPTNQQEPISFLPIANQHFTRAPISVPPALIV